MTITDAVEDLGKNKPLPEPMSADEIAAMRQWEMDNAAKRAAYLSKRGDDKPDRSNYSKRDGDVCALPRRPADLADAATLSTVKRIKNNPKYKGR